MKLLKRGDEVAVLPMNRTPHCEILEIGVVAYVGPVLIELTNGRIYFASDGRSMRDTECSCIVPATDEHRSALKAKEL